MPSRNAAQYRLGLPAWAFPGWKDRYFVDQPSRLGSYASVFSTVEGNTTFYRTPDRRTVDNWAAAIAGRDFRFCFKLPRQVTHEREPDLVALDEFLASVDALSGHLGPFLVQLPASVSPTGIARLQPVFEQVAAVGRFVIEVRHPAFFRQPEQLEPWLERYGAGRVMLDSRPIYAGDRGHPEVLDALHEKPDVPVLDEVYNRIVLVRLILHPDLVSNARYIDEWARRFASWIADGIDCWMMIHCPNNLHCPSLALDFHEALRAKEGMQGLPSLPPWPLPQQQSLI